MKRAIFCSAMCWLFPAAAFAAPNGYFNLPPDVALETAGSWVVEGTRYSLFGIQPFTNGATFTNKAGEKKDGGIASRAVLTGYIKETAPVCAPVMRVADVTYVTCYVTISGSRLDLAMVLIASGYAFAAVRQDGRPQYAPYATAEAQARDKRTGLWQFVTKAGE